MVGFILLTHCSSARFEKLIGKENYVLGISFGGINTGLPPNLVEQIIEAEKQPIKTMQAQKGKSENRLKLVTDLETKVASIRSGLAELASSRGFQDVKLTSGDPNVVTGTVDPQAAKPGNYNIEVVQLPEKAGALTNGFPDKDKTQIGIGYFKFKTNEGTKEVYISKNNNTLEKAASQINSSGIGVRASVINDRKDPDNPYKLMLTADGTGAEKNIEYPTLYFLDGDQDIYMETEREAKNGKVKVDGFEFEVQDSTLKDIIPGVALELKQASPGRAINITVKEDLEVVSGKVKTFVDSMNAVLGFIQQQNALSKESDTSQTLGGDGLLRSIEMRLRQMVQNPQYGVSGSIKQLSQLGISFNRSGLLEFDQKKFDTALASNPRDVQAFLVGDGFNTGFISAVKRETGTMLNTAFGPLANRKKGLQQKIEQADQRIEQKEKQLTRREEQLRAKFARLEETMSKLKSQGSAVSAMGMGGGGVQGLVQG